MNNQHLKDYMTATEGAVEEFTVNEMTRIVWFRYHTELDMKKQLDESEFQPINRPLIIPCLNPF